MSLTTGAQLLEFWLKQDMSPPPGVSKEALREAEARLGVRLPEVFRQYFLAMNGSGECDNELFDFWPIEKLERIEGPDPEIFEYVEFADFCIHAHHYGLKIPRSNPEDASVFVNYWEASGVREIAPSFSEFAAVYLSGNHDKLF